MRAALEWLDRGWGCCAIHTHHDWVSTAPPPPPLKGEGSQKPGDLSRLSPPPNPALSCSHISTPAAGSRRTAVGSRWEGGESSATWVGVTFAWPLPCLAPRARKPIACGETCPAITKTHEARLAACRSFEQPLDTNPGGASARPCREKSVDTSPRFGARLRGLQY